MSYNRGLAQCARIARKLVDTNVMYVLSPATDDSPGTIIIGSGSIESDKDAYCEAVRPIVNKAVRKLRPETLGVIMCAARKDTLETTFAEDNGRAALRRVAIELITEQMMIIVQSDYIDYQKRMDVLTRDATEGHEELALFEFSATRPPEGELETDNA